MTIEDLRETAALAHLNLSDTELEAAFPSFRQMIDFFEAMAKADPGLDSGDSRPAFESGFFRKDAVLSAQSTQGARYADVETLLNNAGERDGPFIVVPNVL
jgi:aspartyl-tRNA(Asn)/glutamyl-tRNA(Gln) amidotransferase subunit C